MFQRDLAARNGSAIPQPVRLGSLALAKGAGRGEKGTGRARDGCIPETRRQLTAALCSRRLSSSSMHLVDPGGCCGRRAGEVKLMALPYEITL